MQVKPIMAVAENGHVSLFIHVHDLGATGDVRRGGRKCALDLRLFRFGGNGKVSDEQNEQHNQRPAAVLSLCFNITAVRQKASAVNRRDAQRAHSGYVVRIARARRFRR
jgi:hypothetical protein